LSDMEDVSWVESCVVERQALSWGDRPAVPFPPLRAACSVGSS